MHYVLTITSNKEVTEDHADTFGQVFGEDFDSVSWKGNKIEFDGQMAGMGRMGAILRELRCAVSGLSLEFSIA